jgi:uncharacterized membrane protein
MNAYSRTRNRLLSGILLLVPFVITLMVLLWLFGFLRRILDPMVAYLLHSLEKAGYIQPAIIPGAEANPLISAALFVLSLLFLMTIIYLVGAIGQVVIGRRIVSLIERILLKVPIAKNVYAAVRQVVDVIAMQPRGSFQSVVLIEFPRVRYKSVGFLTGEITSADGKQYRRVFIPTTPNPTTGFMEIVPLEEITPTDLTIEEGFKIIMSGGLVCPERLGKVL